MMDEKLSEVDDSILVEQSSIAKTLSVGRKESGGEESGIRPSNVAKISEGSDQVYHESIIVDPDIPVHTLEQSSHNMSQLDMASSSNAVPRTSQSENDDINQAWFTTKEDKLSLQGKGVKWRQGMWSKEEVEHLQNNITQYCKNHGVNDPREIIFKQSKEKRKTFYRSIAKGIERPLFAVYRRVLRTYESGNYNGKYTPDEVKKLKELKSMHGNDWTAIGQALGRSASSVKDRCRLLNDNCSSGKWSHDEEELLSDAVHESTSTVPGESVTTGIQWTDVARRVGTRSEKQCRSKWLNYLNWKECGGKEWSKTDEVDLIKKICNLGVQSESEIDWAKLADGWASARSPQWLRSKWWSIKKHVSDSLSFTEKVSYLHNHYAKNLKYRVNKQSTGLSSFSSTEQSPTTSISSNSSLATSATVSTTIGHALTVDGEIYIARGDGKGSDGISTYEMVHLRPIPSTDPSQPTSYIVEPVQCSVNGSGATYILHQASPELNAKLAKTSLCNTSVRQTPPVHDSNTLQVNPTIRRPVCTPVRPGLASNVRENDGRVIIVDSPPHEQTADEFPDSDQPNVCGRVEEAVSDILHHNQQLECASEEEITTTTSLEEIHDCERLEKFGNPKRRCYGHSHDALDQGYTSPIAPQSLHFTHAGSNTQSQSSIDSIAEDSHRTQVIISQPALHENILDAHGDEPEFLQSTEISVSSPLRDEPADSLMMDGGISYFTKDMEYH